MVCGATWLAARSAAAGRRRSPQVPGGGDATVLNAVKLHSHYLDSAAGWGHAEEPADLAGRCHRAGPPLHPTAGPARPRSSACWGCPRVTSRSDTNRREQPCTELGGHERSRWSRSAKPQVGRDRDVATDQKVAGSNPTERAQLTDIAGHRYGQAGAHHPSQHRVSMNNIMDRY